MKRPTAPETSFLTIESSGKVLLSRTEQLTLHCVFEVGEFPNDMQNCSATYVTWAYPAQDVVLQAATTRAQHFQQNSEWFLFGYDVQVKLVDYGAAHGQWYEATYYICIKRKPFYYLITLTLPSFLITNLALMGVFSPSHSSQMRTEKVSIGLTALLTMAVILLIVSDLMPKNATSFPKLGTFLLFEICIMAAGTVVSVCIMILHSRARFVRPIPVFLRRLLLPQGLEAERQSKIAALSTADDGMSLQQVMLKNSCSVAFNNRADEDWLGQVSMQCKLFVTLRQTLQKVRAIEAQCAKQHLHKLKRRHNETDWALICYRLDLAFMTLFVTVNIFVTYAFTM